MNKRSEPRPTAKVPPMPPAPAAFAGEIEGYLSHLELERGLSRNTAKSYESDLKLAAFHDCLQDGEPICGRLQPEKNDVLYAERVGEVASSALLPLPGVGLIAVGSHDPNRFYPGMGTLFLRMMGEVLATALKRFG